MMLPPPTASSGIWMPQIGEAHGGKPTPGIPGFVACQHYPMDVLQTSGRIAVKTQPLRFPISRENCDPSLGAELRDYLHTTSDVFVALQPSDNADDSAAAEGVDPMLPTAEQPATAMRATRRFPWRPHRGGATTRFRLRTGGMIGLWRPCAEQPLPAVVIARAGPRVDAADAQFAAVILTAKAQRARAG